MDEDENLPEKPAGAPPCHPWTLWLKTSCGQPGHPRWWSCAECGAHPEESRG